MKQWTYAQRFQFSGPWNPTGKDAQGFLTAFLNSSNVQRRLQVATRLSMTPMTGRVNAVKFDALRATVTNMNFFDKLTTAGVVRPSGHIVRT